MSNEMNNEMNTLTSTTIDELTLSDDVVVNFLQDNPDFFNRHPSLLMSLRLLDKQRGTVSLVERQQTLLRQKVHALEDEITELMTVANHNEQLFALYSDLYLRLIDCQDGAELLDCLHQATTELLSLAGIKLWLTQPVVLQHPVITEADCKGIVSARLDNETYYFGRLQQKEQQLIFSETLAGSVVLIKLEHHEKTLGFLAISSQDADHFDPRMDTLLIGQFTRLIAKLIAKHLFTIE